jgi:hypothetical protein
VAKADAGAMAVDDVVEDEFDGDELHAANPRAAIPNATAPIAAPCLRMCPTAPSLEPP